MLRFRAALDELRNTVRFLAGWGQPLWDDERAERCHCFGGLGLYLLLPLLLLTFYFNRRIAAKSFVLQSVVPGDPFRVQ